MLSFVLFFVLNILCAIITVIFALIALIKNENKLFSSLVAIFSAILSFITYININVPVPIIFPLDNETHIYSDNVEIIIESGGFDIYYTLDGSDPQNKKKYENPIIIADSTTVSARNKFLWMWSDIVTRAYKFPDEPVEPPLTSESTPQPVENPTPTPEPTPKPTPEPTLMPTPVPTAEPPLEPISIRNVSEFYSDGINHSKSTITDNIGNIYHGYTYMVAGGFNVDSEGSAVYRNDNQYNRFKGWVIIDDIEKNDEDCGWIKIYGDDSLLFDTGTMGRGIEPKDFDLDISTYTEIKIVFKNGNFASKAAKYAQCYLVETYFEEKNK